MRRTTGTNGPAAARLIALSLLIACFGGSPADLPAQNTYNVSQQYGYNGTDDTAALQAALDDPTAAVIVIDALQGSVWRTRGLVLTRDNFRLEFAPGVVLEDVPGALGTFEPLLNIRGASGVTVEGNGATLRIDKSLYPQNSQFRHCILSRGSVGCTIRNLTLTGAAGDGIEVSADFVVDTGDVDGDGDGTDVEPVAPTQNLTLSGLICDANNRQGMSVISVVGLTVTNCVFENTQGTEPESGVDFEPFRRYQPMQNVVLTGCTFRGNHGNGIQFGGVDIDATSPPSSILIQNALVEGNGQSPTRTRAGVDVNNIYNPTAGSDQTGTTVNSATGTFTLLNSTIRGEPYPGINVRQYASGLDVTVSNVTVEDCANTFVNYGLGPVIVQPPFYGSALTSEPCFGNVAFNGVTVVDDQTNRAHVTVDDFRGGPTGPADVTGTIGVQLVGAAASTAPIFLEDPDDCGNFSLTVTATGPLPVELTGVRAEADGRCGHDVAWSVAAAAGLVGFAIEASADGRRWFEAYAKTVDDRSGLGTHRAAGLAGGSDRLYRVRSDFADGTAAYSESVAAPGCTEGSESTTRLIAWSGPAQERMPVLPRAEAYALELLDVRGVPVRRIGVSAQAAWAPVRGLAAGVYVVRAVRE